MRKGMAKRTRTSDHSSANASAEAAEEGRRRLCNGKTATSKAHHPPQASTGPCSLWTDDGARNCLPKACVRILPCRDCLAWSAMRRRRCGASGSTWGCWWCCTPCRACLSASPSAACALTPHAPSCVASCSRPAIFLLAGTISSGLCRKPCPCDACRTVLYACSIALMGRFIRHRCCVPGPTAVCHPGVLTHALCVEHIALHHSTTWVGLCSLQTLVSACQLSLAVQS